MKSTAWLQPVARRLHLARLVVVESVKSFVRNDDLDAAATLAYYGFFALMPLLILMMIVLSRFLFSSDTALLGLQQFVGELFPRFTDAILKDVSALAQQRLWGVVSIVILLWSITPFAGSFRHILLRIFKSDRRMHYVKAKLLDMATIIGVMLVFMFLIAVRIYFSATDRINLPSHLDALRPAAGLLLPFALSVLTIAFLYRVFAPEAPGWGAVFAGSLATAGLLFIIRPVFGYFLTFNPNYGFAFGSLKAVFLVIVWVYYSLSVMLFGAEIMANTRRREALLLRRLFIGGSSVSVQPHPLLQRFIIEGDPGHVLFREGGGGSTMYYILEGSVALSRGGAIIRAMGPGDYFGEMSMLIAIPRTATATIDAPATRLIAIDASNFETILRENPAIVRSILAEMARRLKATNERDMAAMPGKT